MRRREDIRSLCGDALVTEHKISRYLAGQVSWLMIRSLDRIFTYRNLVFWCHSDPPYTYGLGLRTLQVGRLWTATT